MVTISVTQPCVRRVALAWAVALPWEAWSVVDHPEQPPVPGGQGWPGVKGRVSAAAGSSISDQEAKILPTL